MTAITSAVLRRWARNDVVTARRLEALNYSRGAIRSAVAREHLFPAHRGVFFLNADPSQLSRWTAAVARYGPQALLSHGAAAALWRLITHWYGPPHVTLPRGRGGVAPRGIVLHHTTRSNQGDTINGVRVTTLHRTLDDYARIATPAGIKSALRNAEYHHALDLVVLKVEATAGPLRRVLDDYVAGQGLTDSVLEADFYEIVATRTSLRRPDLQRHTEAGRVDFIWPELRLVVEVDGYEAHKGRIAFREDRRRDRAHIRAGWLPLRFTAEDIQVAPAGVADDLTSAASSLSMLSSTKS